MSQNTVTRAQLSEAVYQEVGLSRNESADLVESILDEISDALARGEDCYDFMSTPAGHKPLLSNAEQPMNWLTLGPDRVSRRVEAHCRWARGLMVDAVKRSLRGWIAPAKSI